MTPHKSTLNLILLLLAASWVALMSDSARAVPACPTGREVLQPDGTKFVLSLRGDEFFSWHETEDGYTVVQDPKDGFWKYARPVAGKADLEVIPGARVGTAKAADHGLAKHLLPEATALRALIQERQNALNPSEIEASVTGTSDQPQPKSPSISRPKVSVSGIKTVKNIVILAAFSNHWDSANSTVLSSYGRLDTNEYHNLFNQTGYSDDGAVGSVKDFYLEVSYGKLTLDSVVTMWVQLPQSEAYYGAHTPTGGHDIRAQQMVVDAIGAAVAAGFNFAQGDTDGDGWVDCLTILHSGYDEAGGGGEDAIWSHKGGISKLTTNGVSMASYHTESALRSYTGTGLTRIGTACHELGHFFGLPDLYDTASGTEGLGNWCLMSGASWNGDSGAQPGHFSAWCKVFLGFAKPVQIHSFTGVALPSVENHPVVGMLRDGTTNNEYFLVENRAQAGFDNYPTLHPGVLIYHIDGKSWGNNSVNLMHPGVKIEEADGNDSLGLPRIAGHQAGDAWTSTSGLSGGFRDQTGNTNTSAMLYQSNPTTNSSLFYSRTGDSSRYTCNTLDNFSAASGTMTFDATTLRSVAPTKNALPAAYTVAWRAVSQATKYEIQEGARATLTSFSDGGEGEEETFAKWYVGGVDRVLTNASHGGSYNYYFANGRSLTLQKPFKVTTSTVVSFYVASRIVTGNGFIRCEISNDGGSTWNTLSSDSGNIAPWSARSYDFTAINAAGISAGDSCIIHFISSIEYSSSYGGYPAYGFALDDISITGTEIAGYDSWTTLDNNVTSTTYDVSTKPAGIYAYRIQAYANGAWQGFGPESEITVQTNQAPVWSTNAIAGAGANIRAAYNANLASLVTDEINDAQTFSKVGGPAWLTVNSDGSIAGTPQPADAGTNTFTVRVTDLSSAYADATLTIVVRSPLAEWALNEAAGPTLYDSIGNFHGTAQGSLVYGQPGVPGAAAGNSAAQFDGLTTAVAIPALNLNTNSVTLAALVKATGVQSNRAAIYMWRGSGFGLRIESGGTLGFTWDNSGYNSSLLLPSNQWTFVAMAVNPTSVTLYMMTNSSVVSWTATGSFTNGAFNTTSYLGHDSWYSDRHFRGAIDDFSVYSGTLDSTQISQLATAAFTAVPYVVVSSPADNAGFIKPTSFSLDASVTANGHTINKMQFYNGATMLGEDATPPYTTSVSGLDLGHYTFSAKAVYDGGNVVGSVPITVHVTNAPPVVVADTASTTQNTPVTIPVLANDSDPYNLTLSIQSITQPARGSATIADTNVVYTPNNYWYGVDTFNYTANDGTGSTATTNVTVTTAYPNFPSAYTNAVLSSTPVAYWRLNETGGTTAYDAVGANNGTKSGTITLGTNGPSAETFPGLEAGNTAWYLSGSSSQVALPALNLNSGAMTITAWVRHNGTQYYPGIVSWSSGGTTIMLGFGNNDNRLTYVRNSSVYNSSSLTVPDNQWTFVALALTSSNAVLYMATNATLNSYTITRSDAAFTVFTNTAYLGTSPYGRYIGSMDEVAIYNQLLTPAQISGLLTAAQTALPAVALTTPTNGASFEAPPSVTLSASITTNGQHTVEMVQFLTNGTVLAEVLTPPYTYAWATPPVGSYAIVARAAYDGSGTVDSATANITVTDTTAPTITSVPDGGNASANGFCQAAVPDVATGTVATDNYGTPTRTQSPLAGTLVGLGAHTITITATDSAGNQSTSTTTFTVSDTTAPAVVSVPDAGSATANGSGLAPVPDVATGTVASDNCSDVIKIQSPLAGTMVEVGPHTITVTATDSAGNTNAATTTFTVNSGNQPPVPGNFTLGTVADHAISFSSTTLIGLASDPDGDPMSVPAVSATSAQGGTAILVEGTITYTPPIGYTGSDSFTYTLADSHSNTATGTVAAVVASAESYGLLSIAAGAGGEVEIQFHGIPYSGYALERTHDLAPTIVWTAMVTNQATSAGLVTFTNTSSGSSDFYRARRVSTP